MSFSKQRSRLMMLAWWPAKARGQPPLAVARTRSPFTNPSQAMAHPVLSDDAINRHESRLSRKAASSLDIHPKLNSGKSLVQHIDGDFFAMYPDGYEYGITMNVEAEGKANYCIVYAEDGVEVSADHYYDSFGKALRQLAEMEV